MTIHAFFYLSFGTSAGNHGVWGTMTEDKNSVTAPEGFQLGGFFGRDGDEIDLLGAVWTSIELVTAPPTPAPTPAPAPEEGPGTVKPAGSGASGGKTTKVKRVIQLSESFGGPHGNQFSNQPSATSGQTIASLTVRGAERIDGLTLEVSAPTKQTFTHGEKASTTAPEGYQLGGFFGRDGDEIDLLGVVWTSIEVVEEAAATAVAADEDIVLSETFVGPPGIASRISMPSNLDRKQARLRSALTSELTL
ncbi:unnamed protein product [Phytophthora lilii]|uniref:Unnamed protein product n=1 Tax=Phytophthora lilii TaxID=2077276 RepID=A0A9W6U074_9STRA|nr:unnamed protein product [Phytophthora lilii]